MKKTIDSKIRLNNGVEIPCFGLGVFRAGSGGETRDAVLRALELGYRHVDTAAVYRNERDVGEAIRQSGIPRQDIFVTTKVWNHDHGYNRAVRALDDSLERLGLEYVDLYLIHWPVEILRKDTWRALIALQQEGKCRAIGVSNYTIRHLQEVIDQTPEHVPAVNQVEFNPFLYQRDLLAFCRDHGIVVEAYCPLARGKKLGDATLGEVAGRYGKTPAQIMIRWALEHDLVVIPKSVKPVRMAENAHVFDFAIAAEDMARLDALNQDFRVAWDPTDAP
jgi:methylglyoxal/glyoxal reductase